MIRIPTRRYWLTDASNGLGAALAEHLLKSGAHLALSARAVAPLKAFARRYPGQVLVAPGDLTNSQTVREIGEQIQQDWGALDTVILNAGTCTYVDAAQLDTNLIEHLVRCNLLASNYCIDVALPLLRTGIAPYLVGITSSATYLSLPRSEAQGTSKAGLRHLFKAQRITLAEDGIEVTVVTPDFIASPLGGHDVLPLPLSWTADKAARYIIDNLKLRPLELPLPALSMTALWPLSKRPGEGQLAIGKPMAWSAPPIKDLP
ncbi:short-chain dehydrogenase [Pseudomonas sp. S04]|uniref:SDR family NAD(P)-dependent oxidoreductase n=1 Tax=unclassified Pseudomonas TaxID=196821 RepID=UPI0013200D55|nr:MULTISPECIES: SDR family oxidoreductase [unclassified Pseudomonas]QHD03173.1 short-chain dehydrogenase [Pseudomonas sp. S04]QHF35658.1 short-chain dehydrogenase [Pseudomonas sp. S19]